MVKVTEINGKLIIGSPFHNELPRQAREVGGKWDGDAWVYDARDRSIVRDLYIKIYGQFDEPVNLVSVVITANDELAATRDSIYFLGRQIARATGRDSGAKIGPHVTKKSGRIDSSGSQKNWQTIITEGSEFILHDVPENVAIEAIKEQDEDSSCFNTEILKPSVPDYDALKREKTRLEKRLVEIDNLLKK